ncbi:MAG: nitronate monooxygenase [Planctomycetes bacterium]|nr:nitronate monooxygenase [Planctomycetota bacterium]
MMLLDKFWRKGVEFLGVEYPIISGGMTWISGFELAKAVSANGAFPVIAGGNMPPELFSAEVDKCIKNLNKPFAVNLITIAPNFKQHFEILLKKDVPVVVFAGSFPRKSDIMGMKESGKKTMSFASTNSIAKQQINFGVDSLILEGNEAGGHIGHVSLMILLQQVLFEHKEVPIFVAGGIARGKMIAHLLLMGAAGVQLGTKFVMTEECPTHPNFKQAFIKARARQAISTPQYDSKLPVVAVRAIKNRSMENFGKLQFELLSKLNNNEISREKAQYEVEKYWVGRLRDAVIDGDVDSGSLMAGQSVGLVDKVKPMKDMIQELVNEAEAEIKRISSIFT